jgi:spore germination cell wall hydrolase CwlJ-like protein
MYLSSAAWAGQFGGRTGPFARPLVNELKIPSDAGPAERVAFRRPTLGNPSDEISCLALNIYFEARGEPDEGKLAVGHVVMNRVLSGRFPGTVCDVVQQGGEIRRYRCQFSWWCDGRSDKPRSAADWQRSSELALAIYWGQSEDPTAGALWYHADYVSPAWRNDFVQGATIGRHIFYLRPGNKYQVASRLSGD